MGSEKKLSDVFKIFTFQKDMKYDYFFVYSVESKILIGFMHFKKTWTYITLPDIFLQPKC